MTPLNDNELKLLTRYVKLGARHERFQLFKLSRQASNRLLDVVDAGIPHDNPSDYQLTWLQGINRRRSKNYRKLIGIDKVLTVTALLRDKTLGQLGFGGDA